MEKDSSIEIVFPSRDDIQLNSLNFRFGQNRNDRVEIEYREENEWIQEYELIYSSYILELQ